MEILEDPKLCARCIKKPARGQDPGPGGLVRGIGLGLLDGISNRSVYGAVGGALLCLLLQLVLWALQPLEAPFPTLLLTGSFVVLSASRRPKK